jgi:hypothetical protein
MNNWAMPLLVAVQKIFNKNIIKNNDAIFYNSRSSWDISIILGTKEANAQNKRLTSVTHDATSIRVSGVPTS